MSVVAGLVDRTIPGWPIDRVEAMLAVFRRFCPDGLRTFDRGVCALGIGRLMTSALAAKASGLGERGNVCVVLDGRLDRNTDLGRFPEIDPDASDAEVVAIAYESIGTECLRHLRGDFAIVIWDARSETLVATRDAFAIRPLYYLASGQRLAIASDPEQILAAGLASGTPDSDVVVDYLLWDSRFADRSFFREIKVLPAGHLLIADRDGCRVSRYASPAISSGVGPVSREEYWDEFRRRFSVAVEKRIESAFPVVAELSGGLDSSAIVCVADRILSETPRRCPSLVAAAGLYPGLACNEEEFIRAVAERVRIPVEYWDATNVSVNELDPSSVAVPGGRFPTFAGTDGQFQIAHARNARVIMSGIGGDQIGISSGGIRDAVTEWRWGEAAGMIFGRPEGDARAVIGTAFSLARSFTPPALRRVRAAFGSCAPRPKWLSEWARTYRRPILEPSPPSEFVSEIQRRRWRSLTSGRYAMVMAYMQQHAIRNLVDMRFPFLDTDLVSIAFSIPARMWPAPWPFERLHREILRDWLPPKIVQRRGKANFEPAVTLRVRRHLPFIRDLFSSGSWKSEQFVDRNGAVDLLDLFEREITPVFSVTWGVWVISTLEAWLRAISGYSSVSV